MIYLEAQNRDPAHPDVGVSFTKMVWPFLVERGADIDVSVLAAHGRTAHFGWSGPATCLGRLAALDWRQQQEIHYLSYYGGNMNVVFRTSDRSLLDELVAPWVLQQIRDDDYLLPPSWTAKEKDAFSALVAEMPLGCASFCFGHDGDPLFVFADLPVLQSVVGRGSLASSPGTARGS